MSRWKTLNAASDDYSSYLSYASGESGFESLPEIVASYPVELLKGYQERRSRERRSGAPSQESVVEEEYHEVSRTADKE